MKRTDYHFDMQAVKLQQELTEATSESAVLREKVAVMTTTLAAREGSEREERERLTKRADDLTHQNALLHEEAEKLSARILTLQEAGRSIQTTPTPSQNAVATATGGGATETESSSSEQLWEIIRYKSFQCLLLCFDRVVIKWNLRIMDTLGTSVCPLFRSCLFSGGINVWTIYR